MSKYLVIFLLMFGSTAYAAANKWIDASGQVHYSDKMPPQQAVGVKTIGPNTPDAPIFTAASGVPAASGVAASNTKAAAEKDPAKEAAAKKAAAAKAEQEAAIKAQNQANCAGAKQNMANLKDGMRIATVDPTTGERSFMDDAQRAKSMEDAQQQVSKFCQ
ncbi:MAG: DUF4124 domain-containing protein [Gallionella sp.]|nr:DUF4124 domain-containing protein [Gallionella sp.]